MYTVMLSLFGGGVYNQTGYVHTLYTERIQRLEVHSLCANKFTQETYTTRYRPSPLLHVHAHNIILLGCGQLLYNMCFVKSGGPCFS